MVPVSLAMINERFEPGDRVEPKTIAAKKIVVTSSGRYPKMKILSDGEVTKKFIVSGISISKGAKDKIEKAGGTVHA